MSIFSNGFLFQKFGHIRLHARGPEEAKKAYVTDWVCLSDRLLPCYELYILDFFLGKVWLAGLVCVILGSILDLLSYCFAEMSLLAPIGALTLVVNMVRRNCAASLLCFFIFPGALIRSLHLAF